MHSLCRRRSTTRSTPGKPSRPSGVTIRNCSVATAREGLRAAHHSGQARYPRAVLAIRYETPRGGRSADIAVRQTRRA